MKKIGEYTARGSISEIESEAGAIARIILFDGQWDTGFKVTSFKCWGASTGGSTTGDVVGKLCTSENCETGPGDFFNADDGREIGWSQSSASTDAGGGGGFGESIIDPDNLIIEDLYFYARGAQDGVKVNYIVTMEKYDITDWEGALVMAKDRAEEVNA